MSLDATNWAWRVQFKEKKGGSLKPLKRLVLLSLADRAGEDHTCYPSMQRLEQDTGLERKTVLKIIAELLEEGLIADTGERKGATRRVKVYKLIGVNGREIVPATAPLGGKNLPEIVPPLEQSQQWNDSNNGKLNSAVVGTLNSANNGTQNLPVNLPIVSKNIKTRLCLKKLREEIYLCDSEVDFENLIWQRWYHREILAFENYNADKPMSDDLMIYHFADWLLNAKVKYDRRENQSSAENKSAGSNSGVNTVDQPSQQAAPKKLSDAQRSLLASRLADHSEFASNHVPSGYGYTQVLQWINQKLADPECLKEWAKFIHDVGFGGCIRGVAA